VTTKEPLAVHPGEMLREALQERGWSQADLSRRSGLTQKHISRVVTGQAGIGTEAALAIEAATGISARVLIRMQADYDVTHRKRRAR
jgi:HTH-type transcriptional regulator/antitoxin HigA